MANNQNMLEQILTAALSGGGVRGAAPGGGTPSGGAGNLGDVLGGLLGGLAQGGTTGAAGAGGLAAPRRRRVGRRGGLGGLLGSLAQGATMPGGQPGAAGAGGLGGLLGSILSAAGGSGTGQTDTAASTQPVPGSAPQGKGMSDLVRYGGLAVIGTLAYQAMKRYQAKQAGEAATAADAVPPPDSGFHPEDQEGGAEALSGTLLNAMIAAVQADGVIDEDELRRLTGQLDKLGISSDDRQALVAQLRKRVDPAEVVDFGDLAGTRRANLCRLGAGHINRYTAGAQVPRQARRRHRGR